MLVSPLLEGGLLESQSISYEFKGSSKLAFATAESRVRNLKLIERDEKEIDGIFCGYACYFGNAKYGGYYFATTIFVSGTSRNGRITLTVHSNDASIISGYIQEVMDFIREHMETSEGIVVLSGVCPECAGRLEPSEAEDEWENLLSVL